MNKELYQNMYNNPKNYRFFKGTPFISKKETKNKLINDYQKILSKDTISNEDDFFKEILDFFEEKRKTSLEKEKDLARKIKIKGYPENENDEKGRVKFWTKYFSGIDTNESFDKDISDDLWLKIIFSSSEFAKFLATHKTHSAFYRRGLLKEDETKEEVEKKLLEGFQGINSFDAFNKKLEEYDFKEDLFDAINKIMQEANLGIDIARNNIKMENINITNFDSLKTAIKDWGELITKEALKRVERSEKKQKNGSKIDYKNIRQKLQYLQISRSDKVYLTISLEEIKGEYSKQYNKKYSVAQAFYGAAINIVHNKIFPKGTSSCVLHIGGGRKIELPRKENMTQILINDQLIRGSKVNIKSEQEANIYGFLGEYLRLYEIKNIKLTGDIQDFYEDENSNKKVTLGESFSDAYFTVENDKDSKKYGLNIKHYVSKFESNSITVYNTEEGFSFFSKFMRRYFSEEECKVLRFLDVNYNFFRNSLNMQGLEEKKMLEKYTQMAYKNLSRFARIDSAAVEDFSNLFYVINNVYIPTSYIYTIIYKVLEEEQKKKKLDSFFSLEFNPATTKSINTTAEPLKEEAFLISNFVSTSINATRISFKGLKINGLKELLL